MKNSDSTKWSVGARSETGYIRSENQDRMSRIRANFGDVYIVSDGMGGHKGGATAAELTVQALEEQLSLPIEDVSIDNALKRAFEVANTSVYGRGHSGDPQTEGMGATAVVLLTSASSALVAHVGDSRAYLHHKGRLRRLTKDHTRTQRMVDAGMLSQGEAEQHPDASVLERAIGQKPTVEVDMTSWFRLKKGDEILLCSDGLSGYAEDREIGSFMSRPGSPQEVADRLVDLALAKGGEDNVTVQIVRYGERTLTRRWISMFQQVVPILVALTTAIAASYLTYEYREAGNHEKIASLERRLDSIWKAIAQLQDAKSKLNNAPSAAIGNSGVSAAATDTKLNAAGSRQESKAAQPTPGSAKGHHAKASSSVTEAGATNRKTKDSQQAKSSDEPTRTSGVTETKDHSSGETIEKSGNTANPGGGAPAPSGSAAPARSNVSASDGRQIGNTNGADSQQPVQEQSSSQKTRVAE